MRKLLFLPLFLAASGAMCSDQLKDVSLTLNTAARGVEVVQGVVIGACAEADGVCTGDLIDKATADSFVTVTVKVALGIQTANRLTMQFSQMPGGGPAELLDIINPLLATLEDAISDEQLALVADLDLRSKIQVGLTAVKLAVDTAAGFLEVLKMEAATQ